MKQNGSSRAAIFSLFFFFFQTTHMVGVWPLPLIYAELLKQFCSFWRYFNLPSCHSYLVRKLLNKKKKKQLCFILSCWVVFCTTLGQWAAAWIPCRSPFQPTAGFPRRPLQGFAREILIGGAAAPLASAGAVSGVSYFIYSFPNGVKCEDRLLWFCVTNFLSEQNCKGWCSQVFAHSAIYKQALVRWNWIKSSILFVSFNPKKRALTFDMY